MNRIAFCVCLLVSSLIIGCRAVPIATHDLPATQPATKPTVFPVTSDAHSVVYVCDASGSMMDKFDALGHELTNSIANLKPTQSYSIIFYQEANNEHADDMICLSKELVPASPENKGNLTDFLNSIPPRGGVDPRHAIVAALTLHPDLLYLIIDPCDFPDRSGTLEVVRKLNSDHKTRIMTIEFLDWEKTDEDFMIQLAKENGGTYKFVADKDLSR